MRVLSVKVTEIRRLKDFRQFIRCPVIRRRETMKKKAIALFATFLAIIMSITPIVSIADEKDSVEAIMFRNIPWLTTYQTTKEILDKESDLTPKSKGLSENTSIPDWEDAGNKYATGNKNAGVILKYSAKVAGYDADLSMAFIYPMSENWEVKRDTPVSMFCEATYTLKRLENMHSAYKDLLEKLSSLYGPYKDKSDTNLFTGQKSEEGAVWTAADGSTIYLKEKLNVIIGTVDDIILTYAAPNVNSMLYKVSNYKTLQKREQEDKQRDENSSNYDGL